MSGYLRLYHIWKARNVDAYNITERASRPLGPECVGVSTMWVRWSTMWVRWSTIATWASHDVDCDYITNTNFIRGLAHLVAPSCPRIVGVLCRLPVLHMYLTLLIRHCLSP